MIPRFRRQARLLVQFAFGGQQPVLVRRVKFAGGDLQKHLLDRSAILAHQIAVALFVHGQHGACPNMHGHFALGELAVGQFCGQMVDVEDDAVEHALALDDGFQNAFVASILHDTHLRNMELP